MNTSSEITQILIRLRESDTDSRAVADRVFEVAYAELRRLAAHMMMRGERPDHTLRPTALVHEAYVRLADTSRLDWQSRAHFFRIAARAMREILVDHARRRLAAKREGRWQRVSLDPALALSAASEVDVLRLEEILTELTTMDDRMSRIVELRVFGGMKVDEVAHVLGVSPRTINDEWNVAKMWVSRAIAESGS